MATSTPPADPRVMIRCCDFETTGLDPAKDAVVEIGWCDVRWVETLAPAPETAPDNLKPKMAPIGGRWHVDRPDSILVNPGRHIPSTSSGVYHITDAMVAGAATFSVAAGELLAGGARYLCAHFASFERGFFTVPATWLDTYKLAIYLAPHAPDHKLQTLRYWSNLVCDADLASPPHRAGPDAYVSACLLARMLNALSIEQMVEVSNRPAILPRFWFGKHEGWPMDDIPGSYFEWMLKQDDPGFGPDEIATCRHHLALRRKLADAERSKIDAPAEFPT